MDYQKANRLLKSSFDNGSPTSFRRHNTILQDFKISQFAYLIEDGYVKIISYSESGEEIIHYVYGKGEIFPLGQLFLAHPIGDYFIALTDVTVRTKPIEEFKAFLDDNPTAIMPLMHQQTKLFDRIVNLNMGESKQRIAYRLIKLAERFGTDEGSYSRLDMKITIQELASMVRLSRETTGKVIKQLENKGYLVFGRQHIIIHVDMLKELLDTQRSSKQPPENATKKP
ncbi:MAG: cAMP-binding protein [Candidatus Saccharibacteria bacterium]|nr:cAMP-binding protein [Candidatus Saccharibacteria bacterium]